MQEDDNQSNWTDATQSIAPDDEDDIWVVDDDIINAMEIDSEEEQMEQGDEKQNKNQSNQSQQEVQGQKIENHKEQSEEKQKQNQVNLNQLQKQFVVGKQSNQNWKLGKHDKFCTYVTVSNNGKFIVTGGGDDLMLCFKKQQEGQQWKQFYKLKHTETVNKIQFSYDEKYIVSLTENQAFCTEIQTLKSQKLDIEQPGDLVCHKEGGVVVVGSSYTVSIYNLKGPTLYTSYSIDLTPNILTFCPKGKKIVAVCDNNFRIITPKSGEIIKNSGQFHKQEISAMTVCNNTIFTGCIQGRVFASNLIKGTSLGQLQPFQGTINLLAVSDNSQYLLVAPQGEGVYWIDSNTLKRLFHNPKDISVTDIIQVQSSTLLAVSDLEGHIHLIDRKKPTEIIKTFDGGNSIHKLSSQASKLYAACEDGFMRVFEIKEFMI